MLAEIKLPTAHTPLFLSYSIHSVQLISPETKEYDAEALPSKPVNAERQTPNNEPNREPFQQHDRTFARAMVGPAVTVLFPGYHRSVTVLLGGFVHESAIQCAATDALGGYR